MKRLQISIPKPCHQDWDQMTPDERGRFCSMCKKTVLDFSEKTEDEILDFINSHRNENLCGRFRKDQLEQFTRIELPLPVYRSPMSLLNAFLVALLFCFGTSLFACNMPPTVPAAPVAGLVEVRITENPVSNLPDTGAALNRVPDVHAEMMVMGRVNFSEEEKFTKGKIAVHPDTTVNLPPVAITDSSHVFIVGGLSVERIEADSFIDEADSSAEGAVPDNEINARNFFPSIYPNPSTGLLNIKFKPEEVQSVDMDLYDLSGRLVRKLIDRKTIQPEPQTLQVDISDQPPGIYFIRIAAGNEVKTERVVVAGR